VDIKTVTAYLFQRLSCRLTTEEVATTITSNRKMYNGAVGSKLVEESVKLAYGTHAHVVKEGLGNINVQH
jgi:hypothetical protein